MKETFIIRTEWMGAILELEPKDQATIFRNLFYFHSNQINLINLNNLNIKLVWKFIEPNLIRNIDAYDKRIDTSKLNGKLGGRPHKKEKPNNNLNNLKEPNEPNEPNHNPIVLVPDNVPVPVIVSDNENEKKINIHSLQKLVLEKYNLISKLKIQLTFENCVELEKKYSITEIENVLMSMENYKKLSSSYQSVYLTLLKWLKSEKEKFTMSVASQPKKETIYEERDRRIREIDEQQRKSQKTEEYQTEDHETILIN